MSWHYLQGPGAESSVACCTGGEPLPPLRSKTTHAEFYCNGKLTESYLASLSGTMCVPSTENHGAEKSMSSPEDFRAKTSAPQEKARESKVNAQDSGASSRELSVRYDPATSSWKTHQCLWEEVLPESSVILPKWGMMRSGVLSEHITSAHLISETESGSSENWPTPCATDHKGSGVNGQLRDRLDYAIERGGTKSNTYPTPKTNGFCGGSGAAAKVRENEDLTDEEKRSMLAGNGGQLNPDWVEWLMGWPIGWTDLKPLATDKFQQWLDSHGKRSPVDEQNTDLTRASCRA